MSVDYQPIGVPNCGCLMCGKPSEISRKVFDIEFEYCSLDCVALFSLGRERNATWVFDATREAIIRYNNGLAGPTTIDNF